MITPPQTMFITLIILLLKLCLKTDTIVVKSINQVKDAAQIPIINKLADVPGKDALIPPSSKEPSMIA